MLAIRPHLASLVSGFDRLPGDCAVVSQRGIRLQSILYKDLAVLARRFAAELEIRGIHKGERVLLCGENGSEWVAAFFGCILRGVLPVPVDVASPDSFVRRLIQEVAPRLFVADDERLSRFNDASLSSIPLESLARTVTSNEAGIVDGLCAGDALQIVFTSGTTGAPKGVVHTHGNVLASLQPIENEFERYRRYERLVHPVRVLHTLPLSHVFGQFMGLWTPPVLGLEIHYRNRLVADELVEYIQRHRISVLAAVPRVLDLMEEHLRNTTSNLQSRLDLAAGWKAAARWWHFRDVHRRLGLKFWALVCGGAALSARSEQFWNSLGFVVIQGYGMTETTALVSLNHPFKLARGTVGQVLPGREVRLGDDGEVLVRGATISNTTWQGGGMRPAESDWLATGDLAEMDAQGNLRFRGRKKEVIVTAAGLNIYPEDLEEALRRQTTVRGAAVVEVAGTSGPEPLAVVLAENESVAGAAVTAANKDLAEFQQMHRWMLWPEPDLPRTSTGKVLRREITRRLSEGSISTTAADSDGEGSLDSLGRVQLQAQMEAQFGITLDDESVQAVRNEAEMTELIRKTVAARDPNRFGRQIEHAYPQWIWWPALQAIRAVFLELIAMPLLRFLAKPTRKKTPESLPVGPLLIVANHVTSYDLPFILYALPSAVRRRVAVAMSGEMILDWRRARNQGHWFLNFVAPFQYWLVTALFNVFPLPQTTGFRRSFQHAGEAIDRGYSVLVFPEGRRSDDGLLQPFKSGAGLLWKELGTAALPVRIDGLGELKVKGGGWFRSGSVTVSAGPALSLKSSETPEQLTERLRAGIVDA